MSRSLTTNLGLDCRECFTHGTKEFRDLLEERVDAILDTFAGHVPDEVATPHPRFARAGWSEREFSASVRASTLPASPI